jgi:hypothetical protein
MSVVCRLFYKNLLTLQLITGTRACDALSGSSNTCWPSMASYNASLTSPSTLTISHNYTWSRCFCWAHNPLTRELLACPFHTVPIARSTSNLTVYNSINLAFLETYRSLCFSAFSESILSISVRNVRTRM